MSCGTSLCLLTLVPVSTSRPWHTDLVYCAGNVGVTLQRSSVGSCSSSKPQFPVRGAGFPWTELPQYGASPPQLFPLSSTTAASSGCLSCPGHRTDDLESPGIQTATGVGSGHTFPHLICSSPQVASQPFYRLLSGCPLNEAVPNFSTTAHLS